MSVDKSLLNAPIKFTLSKKLPETFASVKRLTLPVRGLPAEGPQLAPAERLFGCFKERFAIFEYTVLELPAFLKNDDENDSAAVLSNVDAFTDN